MEFFDGLFTLFSTPMNDRARIISRVTRRGKLRTETKYRDVDSNNFAVSTDKNNSTSLFIDLNDGTKLRLDGHGARTLFRLLGKHFLFTNKSINF